MCYVIPQKYAVNGIPKHQVKDGLLALKYHGIHRTQLLLQEAVSKWKWPRQEHVEYNPEIIISEDEFDSDASDDN